MNGTADGEKPLSRQALNILMEIHPLTSRGPFVFPSVRSAERPLSNVALLAALRRMGYEQGTVTVHGFRSTASTLLNEMGQNRDWIERQLAHGERDGDRASYNYADYLPQRRVMMQLWADYLDQLRTRRAAMRGEQLTLEMPWLSGGEHLSQGRGNGLEGSTESPEGELESRL